MRRKCRLALLAASTSGLTLLPSFGHAQVEIENFHNFNPDNYYDAWLDPPPFTTITSGPTNWETASTQGYGSCYYGYYTDNGGAHIDATGEGMLQLSFTINSGDAGMLIDLDDGEGDECLWRMGGYGLQPGTYVIDVPLSSPSAYELTAPRDLPPSGFDPSQITGMNFELDPGATNGNPNPYDVTWTDLSAVNPSLTWNNANYTTLQFPNATADGATWDSANNLNWNNGTNSSVYADGAFVTFNDNNSGNYAVTLNSTVRPGSVTINNALGSYTFSGTGSIVGTASLAKAGTGTATLSTANTYTGGTMVSNGSLVLGNSKALGFGGVVTGNPGSTTVTTGGTLDLGGQTVTQPITLNGGSLINSNTATAAVVGSGVLGDGIVSTTSLSGDASVTFTGSGTGAAATPMLGIGVETFTLTNGGSGYSDVGRGSTAANPTVTVTGGGGSGAVLGALTNTAGVVTGIDIYSPGIGYTTAPTITISAPSAGGTQATVSTTDLFTLLGIEQTAPGTGYYTALTATVTATSGSATLGTPVVSGVNLAGTGNIGGPGNITLAGTVSGVGMFNKIGSGTVTLTAPNSYTGGTAVSAGKLLIEPTGPTTSALPTGSLAVSGGVVQLADNVSAGTALGTSNVVLTSLSLTGNGTLDIGNNRVIIDYSSPATDPIASIAAWIANGAASNGGPSIISSDIAADDAASGYSYGIGYADGADGVVAGLPSGEIEIMFTLIGDANLDGTVNAEDYTPFSHNIGQSGKYWDDGDFNYDGTVNSEDYTPFSHNIGQSASLAAAAGPLQAANGLSMADVPEPASMGLLAIGTVGALSRRRRRM
jgi:autotransporter-associated beta strand protein